MMKPILTKTTLLPLIAALLIGGLPFLTLQSSPGDYFSSEAQTRRARRRPVVRRNSQVTNAAVIAPGTQLVIRLNDRLSSNDSRVGDRFSATVTEPNRYDGARVSGHIRSLNKSGKVKGRTIMTLAFDSIELREGGTGTMRAEVVRVYDSDSTSKVDEEGNVQSKSRGNQTLKRSGIGAAAGAVLGGILGGGKGAAIGLIIGGAAGAGSIAIEGSKELELEAGTEMLIRVTRR
jgi:hypothetical protein